MVLDRNHVAIHKRYAVKQSAASKYSMVNGRTGQIVWSDDLAFIHLAKMPYPLREKLLDYGLAVGAREEDLNWLGVHPRVAQVYLTALAETIARERGLCPVTDNPIGHVAVSGWSVDRIAAGLLNDKSLLAHERQNRPEIALAFLAIRVVVPTDLAAVPVRKIVAFRRRYEAELTAFQDALREFSDLHSLDDIESMDALTEHLHDVYAIRLKLQLVQLKRDMSLSSIPARWATLDIKTFAPPGLLAAGLTHFHASPSLTTTASVAAGVIGVRRTEQTRTKKLLSETPTAYLLHLEEHLTPQSTINRINQGLRRFAIGA